jgi:diguanylate cyclase (GGDEF)-like protein
MPLGGQLEEKRRIEAVEVAWERKNGTILRAKLSGRGVGAEDGHLARYEVIVVDITEQRELENQLRRQASIDALTGLANRRSLFESLHSEICRCQRTGRKFSFVMLDLDGLKEINDRFGHLAGDRALCRLADILVDCSRSVDTLARQGGDEFALMLPETDVASAQLVANRICLQLTKDNEEPALSVSFGIAGFPADGDAIAALIHAADVALYTMKGKRLSKTAAAGVP